MDKIILNVKYVNSNQFQKIDYSAVNAGSAIADTKNAMEDVVSSLVVAALMSVVVAGINSEDFYELYQFQKHIIFNGKSNIFFSMRNSSIAHRKKNRAKKI